jgi:hypothetical protein
MDTNILYQNGQKYNSLPVAPGRIYPPRSYFKLRGRWHTTGARYKLVVDPCPYCRGIHIHGGCEDLNELVPTRQAHCGGGEYRLSIRGRDDLPGL